MPRKTRILHGDDEYLFVEAPGDPAGPSLQVFAHVENARAVAPGLTPTHKTEHGTWIQVARFDGDTLALSPDAPDTLGEQLKLLLPRYAEVRQKRVASAKHPCWWIEAEGKPLHGLHPAQPAGLVFKLWSSEAAAKSVAVGLGVEAKVHSTGDVREFLELRAEEGYAGALLDDAQLVFFCLDPQSRMQFLRLAAPDDGEEEAGARAAPELRTHLLAENGRFELYEGDEELEPFVDPDCWDRLLARTYGVAPFLGYVPGWRCFELRLGREPVMQRDVEADGKQTLVALFHDPAAADDYRARHNVPRATIERVGDLVATVRAAQARGCVVRLHPEDHRVRGGPMWLDKEGALLLLGYCGIWRSRDGIFFEQVPEAEEDDGSAPIRLSTDVDLDDGDLQPPAGDQSSGST
jgi:hypothetical protein